MNNFRAGFLSLSVVVMVFSIQNVAADGPNRSFAEPINFSEGWSMSGANPILVDDLADDDRDTLSTGAFLFGKPQDPALVEYGQEYYLISNIGAYGYNGWLVAVTESLKPLKRGTNPFQHSGMGDYGFDPFSLLQASNDWLVKEGTFFGVDNTINGFAIITSESMNSFETEESVNAEGGDPGFVEVNGTWHVFTETGTFQQTGKKILHTSSDDLDGQWTASEKVLELEAHTGDPDLIRINDWWYMFVDTGRHKNYSVSYAQTTVSDFPNGWEFKGKAIGPNEGNQTWDSPRIGGNRFGIGDADVILENGVVYMVYERPVGVAYRNIE